MRLESFASSRVWKVKFGKGRNTPGNPAVSANGAEVVGPTDNKYAWWTLLPSP